MEIIIDATLRKRIENAAENGSKIASLILLDLDKQAEEVIVGTFNYFNSVRVVESRADTYKVVRLEITVCNKDLSNPNFPDHDNPQAPYFSENRKRIYPSTFADLFKSVRDNRDNIVNYDYTFFDSIIRINSKITLSISDRMDDIQEAYDARFYTDIADSNESPLHHSCMRYEDKARNAADFYANFAGAKILTAKSEDGFICGRAIVWPKVRISDSDGITSMLVGKEVSLLERIYFSFEGIRKMMIDFAKDHGVLLKKTKNTFDSQTLLTCLNNVEIGEGLCIPEGTSFEAQAKVIVPAVDWHKRGVPYMDTFFRIAYREGQLELKNFDSNDDLAVLNGTSGYGDRTRYRICPICGKVHRGGVVCSECVDSHEIYTIFGTQYNFVWKPYRDTNYPSVCFNEDGTPNNHLKTSFAIERLFNN